MYRTDLGNRTPPDVGTGMNGMKMEMNIPKAGEDAPLGKMGGANSRGVLEKPLRLKKKKGFLRSFDGLGKRWDDRAGSDRVLDVSVH